MLRLKIDSGENTQDTGRPRDVLVLREKRPACLGGGDVRVDGEVVDDVV